jgi:hypothetical protein
MNAQVEKIDSLSRGAGPGIPDIRVAAVLIFAIANFGVFLARLVSVWRYGALFAATGGERLAIYPVWKEVHHLSIYDWPLQFPFSLALYNYLFYYSYAFYLQLVGAWGADILLCGRLVTPLFAIAGAVAQWKLVQTYLKLRGLRSVLSFIFSLGLWFCTSIVRQWAISIRPDMAAVALVMIALCVIVLRPRFGFAYAGVLFYLAWSFKQSVVLAFVGVCLFLLFHKRWRDLSVLAVAFAALTATTLMLGSSEYRFNILVAPGMVREFSLKWASQIVPKSLAGNAYWILAPIALLFAASARRIDNTVRLLITVLVVALAGGLAGMTKVGAWDHYLLEAFATGSTLLQFAVFTSPGWPVSALVLFGCVQPALQLATLSTGYFPPPFGTVGIATAAEYADAEALRDRLAPMKKPIFTNNEIFSLPWFSSDNQAPAFIVDAIFHDATRSRCQNGCVEGMLSRGEIPTVLLPSDDETYRNSLGAHYRKAGDAMYAGRGWCIYVLDPPPPSPDLSKMK